MEKPTTGKTDEKSLTGEILQLEADIDRQKNLYESMRLKLPDKGLKLKNLIDKSQTRLKDLILERERIVGKCLDRSTAVLKDVELSSKSMAKDRQKTEDIRKIDAFLEDVSYHLSNTKMKGNMPENRFKSSVQQPDKHPTKEPFLKVSALADKSESSDTKSSERKSVKTEQIKAPGVPLKPSLLDKKKSDNKIEGLESCFSELTIDHVRASEKESIKNICGLTEQSFDLTLLSYDVETTRKTIDSQKKVYENLKHKLPDKGEKLKKNIDSLEKHLSTLIHGMAQNKKLGVEKWLDDCKASGDAAAKNYDGSETVIFNSKNLSSFGDLVDKTIASEANAVQSPSFSGWRDPVRKAKLTEAQPLVETIKRKGYTFSVNPSPFVEVSEENIKKIQHTLVTYPDDNIEAEDPESLKTSLMTHQKQALAWMLWREMQEPSGGILADDMGLGKTLTLIALILKQNESENYLVGDSDKHCMRGTLIVCMASLIHQWNDEIVKHCNQSAIKVLVYHGSSRVKDASYMKLYDVVITTYSIVMSENKSSSSSPLFKLKWERIILDEAHTIKNDASQTAQAIFSLTACRRWAATGTPIHNVFKDMYSLVKFLRFSPFDDKKKFTKLTNDLSESSEKRRQLLVKSILLRRTKDETTKQGKPLVQMMAKCIKICELELSNEEKAVYDKLWEKATDRVNLYLNRQKKEKSASLLVLLLRLQQCCNHIHLLGREVEDDDSSLDLSKAFSSLAIEQDDAKSISSESTLDLSLSDLKSNDFSDKKVKSSKMKKLFEKLEEISSASDNQDKCVIVSQWVSMLDIIALHLQESGTKYFLIAGSTKAEDRQKFVDSFNKKGGVKVMLLSLKAGGVGLNLTGANHLFLMDLHWNPALEMQACDRIHRVGQSKDVTIYKFICKDTIEERIRDLQDFKRSIASDALHGAKQNTKGMTLDDFKILFSVRA